MKNMERKHFIAALAAAGAISALVGATAISAAAEGENVGITPQTVNLQMQPGASVRISESDDKTGMKYSLRLSAEEYTALKGSAEYEVSFGVIIAPSFYETKYGALTDAGNVFGVGKSAVYDWAEEQEDGSFVYKGHNGAEVDGEKTPYRIINVSTDTLKAEMNDESVYTFNGCIYEILDTNIANEFVGVGYMKYTYIEGEEEKTEYRFAKSDSAVRSMAYVAQKACADDSVNKPTDEQKELIKTRYLDKVAEVEADYAIENYDLKGNVISSETKKGKLGTPATITGETIKDYIFDETNENNVLQGTVWADGSLVLKRYYKAESNVYLTYNDFLKDDSNVDAYTGYPGWNDGNRMGRSVKDLAVANDDLPEDIKTEAASFDGALRVLKDGVLNGATQYYNWEWKDINDEFKSNDDNILLPKQYLDALPADYKAVAYRVYVVPEDGKTAEWGVFTGKGKEYQKTLAEGWNTLYIANSDIDFIATENWEANKKRLPFGIFTNVKDLYLSYIGYELGETRNITVKDAGTETETKLSFGWSVKESVTAPLKEGYTFVAYSSDKAGKNIVTDVRLLTKGATTYAHYMRGNVLNALNEMQDIAVDTMLYNYNWGASERISTNTNVMFKNQKDIPAEIESGMYTGSKGMLHVIQNGNVGDQSDESHAEGRSIWFRAGFVSLPEEYTSVSIRVYIETDEGKTARHFMFENENGWNTDKYSNRYITREDMTSGWYTITIPKSWIEKQNIGVKSYFGIGHFDNVKNLYIDYISAE